MRRIRRRPFFGRLRRGERGAVATIFAVLLAGGVVMGMMALSIDVGNIMFERRQLQNGADATSLALADVCGSDPQNCAPDQVEYLLGANAADATAQYRTDNYPDGACAREGAISDLNSALPPCDSIGADAPITDLAECPPLPDWLRNEPTIPYVETYSLTQSDEVNNTILPSYFSRALIGGPGDSSRVKACARAAWGPAGGHTGSVPITLSTCEWLDATGADPITLDGGSYATPSPAGAWPGYGASNPWPATSWERVILLHDPQDESTDCNWNNKDTAGGFGYVDGTNCSATIVTTESQDSWAKIDPGNNVPSGCDTVIPGLLGKVIFLPIFDCLIASQNAPTGGIPTGANCDPTQQEAHGTNSWYHVAGWAKFYLSGYRLQGNNPLNSVVHSSIRPNSANPGPCSASQRCISGWFLKGSLDDATSIVPPGTGTDYGTYAVLPAG